MRDMSIAYPYLTKDLTAGELGVVLAFAVSPLLIGQAVRWVSVWRRVD
jgi:hypothetical protein